jgi:hypothetical protein
MKCLSLGVLMLSGHESVSQLQSHLSRIYAKQNEKIGVETILMRLLEAASEVTSPFGLEEGGHGPFLRTLSWFFTFCSSDDVKIDIEQAVVRRYPELCPKCKQSGCICERTYGVAGRARHFGTSAEHFQSKAERMIANVSGDLRDLSWFSKTLSDIYLVNLARWKVNRYYFPTKLLRETGKLANGYRCYLNARDTAGKSHAKVRLENDAADFFAWLIAYWQLTASELPNANLQDRFVARYGNGCPYCHQIECACSPAMTRTNRAQIARLEDLDDNDDNKRKIEELIGDIINSLDQFPELDKKYKLELRQQKPAKEISLTLNKILGGLDKVDKASTSVENVVRKAGLLQSLLDSFIL